LTQGPENRLAGETSPYLLQHARNPVDWYPWGPEALERARREDRPIFLSIGYSACHWCHVMEHESFEDPETARLLNESFVCIKVDREERPDLDEIYMQAVQLFTGGHGGWPMSVFLTPALEPYFGGTYFPPADRHGMPGFRSVLRFAADAYRTRRQDVGQTTRQVVEALQQMAALPQPGAPPGRDLLDRAFEALLRGFDAQNGGFGGAPKFPPPMALSFLMRHHARSGRPESLDMVHRTLQRMASGGLYDQLGGGFHRYSVDAHWLVPHFEKMLYDNALLARTYLEAYVLTGEPSYRDVTLEVLDWVAREMTSPQGGFYSAQDADSEGVEGKFFAWRPQELVDVLGEPDARIAARWFDVGAPGNFEHGASVLSVPRDAGVVAAELGIGVDELRATVARARASLFAARERRVHPGRDDKIIVAWNGLMISAFARAHQVLGRPEDLARGRAAADFVLERAGDGLFRTARDGRVQGRGFLDDHACFIAALLDLYEACFEPRWIEAALRFEADVERQFADQAAGGFFYSGGQHETLLARSRHPFDTPTPSGNAVHCQNLLRLALLDGDAGRRGRAERTLALFEDLMRQYPSGTAEMLCGLDLALGPALQVAVAGGGPGAAALLRAVHGTFAPRKVVAGWPAEGPAAPVALLEGRQAVAGRAAAYVCRDFACLMPITDPEALARAVREAHDGPAASA
jgi:uncharacterized protein YyaL (SSP411 family)